MPVPGGTSAPYGTLQPPDPEPWSTRLSAYGSGHGLRVPPGAAARSHLIETSFVHSRGTRPLRFVRRGRAPGCSHCPGYEQDRESTLDVAAGTKSDPASQLHRYLAKIQRPFLHRWVLAVQVTPQYGPSSTGVPFLSQGQRHTRAELVRLFVGLPVLSHDCVRTFVNEFRRPHANNMRLRLSGCRRCRWEQHNLGPRLN